MDADVQMPEGSTVQLKCHASGAPAPSVTWYKDGRQYFTAYYDSHHGGISSAEGQVLELNDVTAEDSGEYRCVAMNVNGEVEFTYKLDVVTQLGNVSFFFVFVHCSISLQILSMKLGTMGFGYVRASVSIRFLLAPYTLCSSNTVDTSIPCLNTLCLSCKTMIFRQSSSVICF